MQAQGLNLHSTFWQVLKPRPVLMANGMPGYEIMGVVETLAEASEAVKLVPGGAIMMVTCVYINAAPVSQPPVIKPS